MGEGSTDNWGVVDDMAGGVGGDVLLDRDLGDMVDLVVDIVSNMLDNRGGGNSNRGSMSIGSNSWGSNDRSSMSVCGNSWGSMSISGNSWGSSWGSNSVTGSINTSYKTMSKETMSSKELSISISSWGSKATSNNSREDNKALHLVLS